MNKEQKKGEIKMIRRALLKNLMALQEEKKKEIAEALGMPPAHLSRLYSTSENEQNRRGISDKMAEKIEQYFDLPVGWLSNPANLESNQRAFLETRAMIDRLPSKPIINAIPLFTNDIAVEYLENPNAIGIREYVNSTIHHSQKAIAVIMPDQSMHNPNTAPSLCKDDILIVEPNITPSSGDIVFILPNPENKTSIFAQLMINAHGERFIKHTNPEMPVNVQLNENATIIGVVIERQTRLYSQASLSQRINF